MRRQLCAVLAVVLLIPLVALDAAPAAAETASAGPADITLSMSVISLTERDHATDITVTAVLRSARARTTTIALSLEGAPLLTPGVKRGAAAGRDYTREFERASIDIAPGSLSGTTTLTIDPIFDTFVEGDEAVVLTGETAGGDIVAPTDLVIEDGPYLSFPRYISGELHYPGQPVSITVEEAINELPAGGTVTYALTRIDPPGNPLGLAFDPATRQLTGTAPAADGLADTGLTTQYTIPPRPGAGPRTSTLVSVAVVPDVCGSTTATWFHATDRPPPELVRDCNVLLAARDTLRGTGLLNWATDTLVTRPWHGIELDDGGQRIAKIELQLRQLNGTIPPVLGHLSSAGPLHLVLGGDHRLTDPLLENRLTGPIPPELGLLPNLTVLALSFNNLNGPIPRELANSGKLTYLYLEDTDGRSVGATGPDPSGVSGPIPPEFGDLPLRALNIIGNPGVDGPVPWQLGKNVSAGDHPGLQVLILSDNNLEGNIPWQLGRFGRIQRLELADNRLGGGIPWQLGNLGNEEADVDWRTVGLDLSGNRLRGGIPPELGAIANLAALSLGENRLSGSIPAELGTLNELTTLYLDRNRLSGEIPTQLGQLSQLQVLSLSCNDLSGAVPASIGAITTLAELSLQGNPALDVGGSPSSLQRDGLTTTWTGECRGDPQPVEIEVTVSRSVSDRGRFFVSTRTEGQDWTTHDAVGELSQRSASGRFDRSTSVLVDVEVGSGVNVSLNVVIWREVRRSEHFFVSTRPTGQGWTTHNTVIKLPDSAPDGFSHGNAVRLEVELR